MNYEQQKERLISMIEQIEQKDWEPHDLPLLHEHVSSLKSTITNDFFTVVVLGEFKRGKSTFVNALLETDLLPRDVTPATATINAIMHSNEKVAQVVFTDGRTEDANASLAFLNDFSVSGTKDTSDIEYIKIGLPALLLEKNVILIDTPGVSDLNEQRVQVTYDFLPKADVVIFMLDATSPMKRTEKEFIEEHLLSIGLNKIMFIANRFDEVDEEDDNVIEDIRRRLISSFKETGHLLEPEVTPFSARDALEGVLKKDAELITRSNLESVRQNVKQLIEDGTASEQRIRNYNRRLSFGIKQLTSNLEKSKSILYSSTQEIDVLLHQMEEIERSEIERGQNITQYVDDQKRDLQLMIQKSLNHFFTDLQEDLFQQIDIYKGSDFKHFIEKTIVHLIRKRTKNWIGRYALSINQLLGKIDAEIASALSRHFNTRVAPTNITHEMKSTAPPIIIHAEDLSGVTMKAGLLVGGAAGLLALTGAGLLTPLVGFAGFPYLQKSMLEQNLKSAKENILPELVTALKQSEYLLATELEQQIDSSLTQIKQDNEKRYHELFNRIQVSLENERTLKNQNKSELFNQRNSLEQKQHHLNKLAIELGKE